MSTESDYSVRSPRHAGIADPDEYKYLAQPDTNRTGARLVQTALGISALFGAIAWLYPPLRIPAGAIAALPLLWLASVLFEPTRHLSMLPFRFIFAYKAAKKLRLFYPTPIEPLQDLPPIRDPSDHDAIRQLPFALSPGQADRLAERREELEALGFRRAGLRIMRSPRAMRFNALLELFEHDHLGHRIVVFCGIAEYSTPPSNPIVLCLHQLTDGRTIALGARRDNGIFPRPSGNHQFLLLPQETSVRELYETHRAMLRFADPTFRPLRHQDWDEYLMLGESQAHQQRIARGIIAPSENPHEFQMTFSRRLIFSIRNLPFIDSAIRRAEYQRTRKVQKQLGISPPEGGWT